jgi:hypothetical protein
MKTDLAVAATSHGAADQPPFRRPKRRRRRALIMAGRSGLEVGFGHHASYRWRPPSRTKKSRMRVLGLGPISLEWDARAARASVLLAP